MVELENMVIKCCQEVISENHGDIVVGMETELTSDVGIDSLGLVSLVLLLEDNLGIDLDEYLMEIRSSKSVDQLVKLIYQAIKENF